MHWDNSKFKFILVYKAQVFVLFNDVLQKQWLLLLIKMFVVVLTSVEK